MFSNKSILFIDNEKSNFSFASNSFLLIINDEFISNSCIDNDSDQELITRDEINGYVLKEKLKKINLNSSNILNLNIDIINLKKINLVDKNIKEIHPNLFNGLVNLMHINLSYNKILQVRTFQTDGFWHKDKAQCRF